MQKKYEKPQTFSDAKLLTLCVLPFSVMDTLYVFILMNLSKFGTK